MQKQLINVDDNTKNINKNKTFTKTSSKKSPYIKFHFINGDNLSIDKNQLLSFNPCILNNNNISIQNINDNSYQINMPKNITKEELSYFLSITESGMKSIKDENIFGINDNKDIKGNKIMNLIKISDYFNNEEFIVKLINDIILPFNYDNIIIELLDYSYKKLCINTEQKEKVNNAYFDLFYNCLENISKNEIIVLNNLDKIKYLDKKIIDEIIEKTFQNLIYGTTLLIEQNKEMKNIKEDFEQSSNDVTSNNLLISPIGDTSKETHILKDKQFKELIYFLMEIKNKKNFFDLLTSEYAFLLSKDSINELKNLPHPSLQVDIHFSDYSFYSQEFPLEIILNHKKIILVVSYKKIDQSFNVCLKLANYNNNIKKNCNSILEIDKISEEKFIEDNSCFKIFTFLTHVIITKGPERISIATQNNLLSLSNNKTIYSILKISNFDNELRNFLIREPEKEYFSVIVHIKLCYIYSALASFLLKEFSEYSKDPNIYKISKQLLILILENKYIRLKDKDIIETILLWFQDENNIKEDISSILEVLKWEDIDDNLIFELIIKYSHIIVGNNILEKKITDAFEKKYKNPIITENILKSLFIAGQKIEYNRIYSQMKKSEKYSKAHKYFNSEAKFNGIFYATDNNSSLSKDSCSFKDGIQNIIMNYNNNIPENENEKIINNKNIDFENKKYNINEINNINANNNKNNNQNNINIINKNNIEKKCTSSNTNIINKNNIEKKDTNSNTNIINNKDDISLNNKNNYNKINKLNKRNEFLPKNNKNKIKEKNKSNDHIIFYKNNANFLKKNLSFLNIKQKKNPVKPNINKKIRNKEIKKLSFSYYKNAQNTSNINDKSNISNVSININNISNINISNNNYSNYKTQNNDYFLKNYVNKNNDNSFSLTFFGGKSQEKFGQGKNCGKKYDKNKNINFPIKLFSTGNSENNYIKKNNKKLDKTSISNNKTSGYQNSHKNQKKFNTLLSTILNYDKIINKSKNVNKKNKNSASIKKMVINKNPKKREKSN